MITANWQKWPDWSNKGPILCPSLLNDEQLKLIDTGAVRDAIEPPRLQPKPSLHEIPQTALSAKVLILFPGADVRPSCHPVHNIECYLETD